MTILSRYAISLIVGLSSLGLAWWGWTSFYFEKGKTQAVRVIDKATSNAANKGKRAADKSLAHGVRGVRDPTTRDN